MTDWGVSGRRDEFTYWEVDPFTLEETGEQVDAVEESGRITWGLYTDNWYSGSVDVHGMVPSDRLIRVKQRIELPDGTACALTLATMFADQSKAQALNGSVTRTASCYSTLWRYTQDVLADDFAYSAGEDCVANIRRMVEMEGGLLRVGSGVRSVAHSMTGSFEIGTNRATALNTYANWIDCQVSADADGRIALERYMLPAEKAVSYVFEEGENCMFRPGFALSDNGGECVNRVVAYWSRDEAGDDGLGATGRAVADLPDSDPFSYRMIGRHQTHMMQVDEPCSEASLMEKAQRYLEDNRGAITYVEIDHPSIPTLRVGDKVRYVNTRDTPSGLDALCMVTEIAMTLGKGAMCHTKMKVVG